MILFVVGRLVLKRSAWRWIAALATLGPLMAFVQLAPFSLLVVFGNALGCLNKCLGTGFPLDKA